LRIALASFIEPSAVTGMGKWTQRIGERLRSRGHDVVSLDVTSLNVDAHSTVRRHLFGFTVARALWRTRESIDALVVHEPHALIPCLARRAMRAGVVVMSHGVENRIIHDLRAATRAGFASTSPFQAAKHRVLWGWREALAFVCAPQVLCLAEVDRRYLAGMRKRDAEAVSCFINGVDPVTNPFDAGSADGVFFLGTWIPEKGSRVLPRIWRAVRSTLPTASLTIAGTGVGSQQVLESFSLEDRGSIRVVPAFEGPEQLGKLIGSAGVFLLPSLREGSPLALLEAMSHGVPPVASAVGGVPEIVTDGTGYLHAPLDTETAARHVCDLLQDVDLRRRMGSAAVVRARACTWDAAAAAVERACERAVGT
jgi:glycosyltransferase involved in cell wall biosynthesis